MKDELHFLDIGTLAGEIRSGRLSPVKVTETLLDRIEKLDGHLRSYVSLTAERALEWAREAEREIARGDYRGPLHGVPLGIKDVIETDFAPTSVGISQYPGGKEYYAYLVKQFTTMNVTPEEVWEFGKQRMAEIGAEMAAVREQVGFQGTAREFHEMLRTDPRFLAKTPQEVEDRFNAYIERIEPLVENMVESIFRNQDALLPLARLKNHDDYTFEHSVGVCALLVAFGRGMKLDKGVIKDMALGGLLHDVGKARIPDAILNKPGKLSDDEFARMKSHVDQGVLLLQQTPGIPEIALRVTAEHHERFDGTGYPQQASKAGISLYGQMAAIVDVYDAISSDRIYHKGMPPTQALKKLLDINPHLLGMFVQQKKVHPLLQQQAKTLLMKSGAVPRKMVRQR